MFIRLVFSGEVDRLEGKVLAIAENKNQPRLGVQHEDTQLPTVDYVDIPLLMEPTNESTLENIEANFEIRS